MLFRKDEWDAIASGRTTAAIRRWKRPTVKEGGTLISPVGVLAIHQVRRLEEAELTLADARAAGFASVDDALASPGLDRGGDLFLIRFSLAGEDPRIALRADDQPDRAELDQVVRKLEGMDRRAAGGPWTRRVLELIRDRPGVRAADLAAAEGRETLPFKADVRKLKAQGLTESLEVGYRLSPRGVVVLAELRSSAAPE